MLYRFRAPRPPLDALIASIWVCRNDPQPQALERILPTGAAQLIVNLKEDQTRLYNPARGHRCETTAGTVLAGPASRFSIIDTSEQEYVLGACFKPGGTVAFMRPPAHEARDVDIPLECLWGRRHVARLREQLLEHGDDPDTQIDAMERALLEMRRPPGLHPAVAFALRTLDRTPHTTSIGAVTDAIGMSPMRFIERFKGQVGVTPKRYCRIRRFQAALTLAHRGQPIDWTRVAMDCGYFDQAHFIHDFRAFAGITPTGYQAARTQFQNHVKFLQSDID